MKGMKRVVVVVKGRRQSPFVSALGTRGAPRASRSAQRSTGTHGVLGGCAVRHRSAVGELLPSRIQNKGRGSGDRAGREPRRGGPWGRLGGWPGEVGAAGGAASSLFLPPTCSSTFSPYTGISLLACLQAYENSIVLLPSPGQTGRLCAATTTASLCAACRTMRPNSSLLPYGPPPPLPASLLACSPHTASPHDLSLCPPCSCLQLASGCTGACACATSL